MRFRNFVFTSFKLDLHPKIQTADVQYLIYQIEECPKTKKHHIQGYCELKSQLSLSTIRNMTQDNQIHIEKRYGSQAQAISYASKSDTRVSGPYEIGTRRAQGNRNDLAALTEQVTAQSCLDDVADQYPCLYIKYYKGIEKLINSKIVDRTWKPEVILYWGPTGTGKTKRAFEQCNKPYIHNGGVWFDGYEHNEDVIFDDFFEDLPSTYLLRLIDCYPMRVPIKGGFVKWVPKRIFFTSNIELENWYRAAPECHRLALWRRFDTTQKCTYSEVEGNTIPQLLGKK